jgi:hypothetical protein
MKTKTIKKTARKPYKGKKYNKRRKNDTIPTTLDKVMKVFKYIIYLTPICCCIIATWTGDDRWIITAVHTLALSLLIQITED